MDELLRLVDWKFSKLDKQKIMINNWLQIADNLINDSSVEEEQPEDESLDDLIAENSDDSLETWRLKWL